MEGNRLALPLLLSLEVLAVAAAASTTAAAWDDDVEAAEAVVMGYGDG